MIIWNKKDRNNSVSIKKSKLNFELYWLVTGEKRQRSESNDSDQPDEDCLPQKQEVFKKHKSFELTPSAIYIGRGKEPASGKTFQKKGIPLEYESSLPIKKQRTHKGKCSVLIKIFFYYIYTFCILPSRSHPLNGHPPSNSSLPFLWSASKLLISLNWCHLM